MGISPDARVGVILGDVSELGHRRKWRVCE